MNDIREVYQQSPQENMTVSMHAAKRRTLFFSQGLQYEAVQRKEHVFGYVNIDYSDYSDSFFGECQPRINAQD